MRLRIRGGRQTVRLAIVWWATLFDETSGDFHIFRLDVAARSWVDTGTLVDTRPNSRSDALWTGQHLYVANHVFAESGGTTGTPPS